MIKKNLSIFLGLSSFIAYFFGFLPFDVNGPSPLKAYIGGSVAIALYLAVCQFIVTKRGSSLNERWHSILTMIAPLAIITLLIWIIAESGHFNKEGISMLASGVIGSLAGAGLARLVKK
jgi:hypothetical protein